MSSSTSVSPSVLGRLLLPNRSKTNKSPSGSQVQPCWSCPLHLRDPSSSPPPLPQLRVLVYRECDGKPRKLYFDSDTVRRDSRIDRNTKYDQICEGFAYKYEKSKSDVKNIGEMIFGSIPPSGKSVGFKVHFMHEPEQQMWSTTFAADMASRANMSVGSSFGSNLSCVSLDNSDGSFPFLMDLDHRRSSERDSGIYSVTSSSGGPNSNQMEQQQQNPASSFLAKVNQKYNNGSSQGMKEDAVVASETTSCQKACEYNNSNSNIGSCSESSLHLRWRCSLDFYSRQLLLLQQQQQQQQHHKSVSLDLGEDLPKSSSFSSPFKAVINSPTSADGGGGGSGDSCGGGGESRCVSSVSSPGLSGFNRSVDHLAVNNSSVFGKKTNNIVLGLAVIIKAPSAGMPPSNSDFLGDNSSYLEDIHNKFRLACVEAYQERQKFIHLVYEAWMEAKRDLQDLFAAPRMEMTAWHVMGHQGFDAKNPELSDERRKFFVQEFLFFLKNYDTKDTNFFFSTFLSAFLTQSLGWVSTVNDSEEGSAGISGPGPKRTVVELCRENFYYDVQEVQFMELHGMTGFPCKATKSVLIGTDLDLVRRFMYVVSYFLRCCKAQSKSFSRSSNGHEIDLKTLVYRTVPVDSYGDKVGEGDEEGDRKEKVEDQGAAEPSAAGAGLKKSNTARNTLASMDESVEKDDGKSRGLKSKERKTTAGLSSSDKEEVIFLLGGNEMNLANSPPPIPVIVQPKNEGRVGENVDGVVLSMGSKIKLESEDSAEEAASNDRGVRVDVYVPMQCRTATGGAGSPLPLPSLICQSASRIIPGSVLQGCVVTSAAAEREETDRVLEESIVRDLRSSLESSFVDRKTDEFLCLTGDLRKGEVKMLSSKRGQIRGPSVPFYTFSAPLVVSLMDDVSNFSFDDHELTLMIIEDKLRDIYGKSCLLAKYLMSVGLTKMDDVVSALKMEPNDIPLLLAVASTHTPEISAKYGISVK